MSTFRKLFSVNAILAGTLVIGMINSVAIAAFFGLDRQVDAYFASLMLVKLFMSLVVDYLGKNFLPVFASRHEESSESASELASLVVTQITIAVGIATILLIVFAPQIFSLILPGFESADIDQVASMFAIMAPSLVFMVVETFHAYVWQHSEHYSRVVFARVFVPLTLAFFIVVLSPSMGFLALPVGFLCGHIICTCWLSVGVPYRFRLSLGFSDAGFRKIVGNSVVLMGTGVFARSRSVIMQYFGSLLGEGAISAMAIAHKLCTPVHQRAQAGIRMIVFSRSAKASAKVDMKEFARLYNLSVVGILFFVTPLAVWYALESDVIVRAVFQRGKFTDGMATLVIAALVGSSIGMIFAGIVQLLSNGFYALGHIKVPVIVMPLGTALFLVLAIFLSPAMGVMGLTLSSSIASMVLAAILTVLLRGKVPGFNVSRVVFALLKYTGISVIAVIGARELRQLLDLHQIPGFICSAVAVAIGYLILQFVTRDKMLLLILKKSGIR